MRVFFFASTQHQHYLDRWGGGASRSTLASTAGLWMITTTTTIKGDVVRMSYCFVRFVNVFILKEKCLAFVTPCYVIDCGCHTSIHTQWKRNTIGLFLFVESVYSKDISVLIFYFAFLITYFSTVLLYTHFLRLCLIQCMLYLSG